MNSTTKLAHDPLAGHLLLRDVARSAGEAVLLVAFATVLVYLLLLPVSPV